MNPVRPSNLPATQVGGAGQGGNADRTAAQKAFFDIAMGKTPAQAAAAPSTPAVYAQPVQRIPEPGAEPPTKILRPGSLLDIRV